MSKKVLIAMHSAMLQQIDEIIKKEHSTRSEWMRKVLREGINDWRKQQKEIGNGGTNQIQRVPVEGATT